MKSEIRNEKWEMKWNEMEITQIRNEKLNGNGNQKSEIKNEMKWKSEIRN